MLCGQLVFLSLLIYFSYGLKNLKIQSRIDLQHANTRYSVYVTAENDGTQDENVYLLTLEKHMGSRLSFISVLGSQSELNSKLVGSPVDGRDYYTYAISLDAPLAPKKQVQFTLQMVFNQLITPFPEEVTQNENQLVKLEGNAYFFSPYPTVSMRSIYIFPTSISSSVIVSYSKNSNLKPFDLAEDKTTISYGPYNNIAPFSSRPLSLHYLHNVPFIHIKSVKRTIEVLNFGGVSVSEKYDLVHVGAKLKNGFARHDINAVPRAEHHMLHGWTFQLPKQASDVYYIDEIGNLSTSNYDNLEQTIQLRPRYPMFGGWENEFNIGYKIPYHPFISQDGSYNVLTFPFVNNWLDFDISIGHIDVVVILPEGSQNVEYIFPFDVVRTDSVENGKTVITLSKDRIVGKEFSEETFEIKYQSSSFASIKKPILISGIIGAILAGFFLLNKLNLFSDSVSLVSVVGVTLEDIYNQREKCHNNLEQVLQRLITTGKTTEWESARGSAVTLFNSLSKISPVEDKNLQTKLSFIEERQKAKQQAQFDYGDLMVKSRSNDSPAVKSLEENYKELTQELDELFEDLTTIQ